MSNGTIHLLLILFSRFRRDGYGTVLEPKGQKIYADGITQKFEGLESEWPIFHAFMVIDGVFKNIDQQVDYHQTQLKRLIKYTDKGGKFGKRNIVFYNNLPTGTVFKDNYLRLKIKAA